MSRTKAVLPVLDGSVELAMLMQAGSAGAGFMHGSRLFTGQSLVAGIDEVGRGPLAGPVVAAAVILDLDDVPAGLADSKQLTPARRSVLYDVILAKAQAVSIAMASPQEIDAINIREATHLAMRRCAAGLALFPSLILVDGHETAGLESMAHINGTGQSDMRQSWNVQAIIKGDTKLACIAAASIIAKVTRDRLMARLHQLYPHYGFATHQGYGTAKHIAAINQSGPSLLHRFSFAPVKGRWQKSDILA